MLYYKCKGGTSQWASKENSQKEPSKIGLNRQRGDRISQVKKHGGVKRVKIDETGYEKTESVCFKPTRKKSVEKGLLRTKANSSFVWREYDVKKGFFFKNICDDFQGSQDKAKRQTTESEDYKRCQIPRVNRNNP